MTTESEKIEYVSSPSAEYDSLRALTPESPCPYLPGHHARNEAYLVEQLDGHVYERLMALGFRRSGDVVYRPVCRACNECRQLRVPVTTFRPTKSMRRVWRINTDLRVDKSRPSATDEKYELFARYLESMHDGLMDSGRECFHRFLYDSPTATVEFVYRAGARIVGVSIVDRCPGGLSSVYMYFDPDAAHRSLGTYSVLWEIEYCRQFGLPYYYLGFYVAGSKTMAYKARFRPNEILVGADCWRALRE